MKHNVFSPQGLFHEYVTGKNSDTVRDFGETGGLSIFYSRFRGTVPRHVKSVTVLGDI